MTTQHPPQPQPEPSPERVPPSEPSYEHIREDDSQTVWGIDLREHGSVVLEED